MLLPWSLHSSIGVTPALVPESFLGVYSFFQLCPVDAFVCLECCTCLDWPLVLNLGTQDCLTAMHHLIKDFGASIFPTREGIQQGRDSYTLL